MVTNTSVIEPTCASQCQDHTHASQHSVASPTLPLSLVPASCKVGNMQQKSPSYHTAWDSNEAGRGNHTCQLSRNIRDSHRFTALVPCPARKMLFTLNVPENLVTNYPDLLGYWYCS